MPLFKSLMSHCTAYFKGEKREKIIKKLIKIEIRNRLEQSNYLVIGPSRYKIAIPIQVCMIANQRNINLKVWTKV